MERKPRKLQEVMHSRNKEAELLKGDLGTKDSGGRRHAATQTAVCDKKTEEGKRAQDEAGRSETTGRQKEISCRRSLSKSRRARRKSQNGLGGLFSISVYYETTTPYLQHLCKPLRANSAIILAAGWFAGPICWVSLRNELPRTIDRPSDPL